MWFSQESNSRYMEGGRNDFLFCCRLLYMLVFPSFWQLELQITGVLKGYTFPMATWISWPRPLLYIELTISFLIGRKRTAKSRNQCLWGRLAADYTTIVFEKNLRPHEYVKSPFLKIYNLEKQKHDFYYFFGPMYNRTIIRFGCCDNQNNQGLAVRVITPTAIVAPIEKW